MKTLNIPVYIDWRPNFNPKSFQIIRFLISEMDPLSLTRIAFFDVFVHDKMILPGHQQYTKLLWLTVLLAAIVGVAKYKYVFSFFAGRIKPYIFQTSL